MIFLVQSSFARITQRADEFGMRFYKNIFEAHPELHPLFRNDLSAQTKMLMSILSSAVRGLNRMQEMVGGLRALGKRHPDYGVKRVDYDKVSSALMRTLEEFLADEFTPELHHAWMTVYGMIAETATNLRRDKQQGLTVRPELVEGWTVKPFMVRQAHHERLNLKLSRLKLVAAETMIEASEDLS